MVANASATRPSPPHQPRRRWFTYWDVFKKALSDFFTHNVLRLAASLAFYTMLSLAPLLVLAIKVVGMFFGEKAVKSQINGYLSELMGENAANTVAQMLGPFATPGAGIVATVIGIIVLIVGASAIFGELQDSLNTIWEVKPKPDRSMFDLIRERFFSVVLVFGTCFLLLVSLIVSAGLSGLTAKLWDPTKSSVWHVVDFLISFLVITVLFALILKYLPDVKIKWRDVWFGAIVTAVLFSVGKFLLGWYLGRASTVSVYGAAGSIIAVLLWVYYSAQILFFGAEMTQAHAHLERPNVPPAENAVKVTEQEKSKQGIVKDDRVRELANADDRSKHS